ncbi:uncharacterized protein BCR38DRAFT_384134 [Pseudomassariella vexata]|uniref:Peptidyl-prolyl cis-trans isomerase n=1 Tax=Pseudomassariella vexata TaxID=1141098 RepID=A0A1Y2EDY9_9PEZI|nr:uncharacterized protein BCR38DRAFT_384134 [Pseudomassariella vexata]ORY69780.1 hypothetical protein BCR38DRAFT_384134 [Pseudomassariella vexata]
MAGKKKAETKSKDNKDAGGKGGKGKSQGISEQKSANPKVRGAQSIVVRHILCEKHSKKEEALAKLRAGVDFKTVVAEFSTEKIRTGKTKIALLIAGGALGLKSKGTLEPEFEKVAFELPAFNGYTTANYPYGEAKTQHGYHIIAVDARK